MQEHTIMLMTICQSIKQKSILRENDYATLAILIINFISYFSCHIDSKEFDESKEKKLLEWDNKFVVKERQPSRHFRDLSNYLMI